MTIAGVEITDQIKRGMVSASLVVEAKINRRLTIDELDMLIIEFVRQVAERDARTVH